MKNHVIKATSGIQNAIKPFHANGPDLKNVMSPPGTASKATQKLKYPTHRGNRGGSVWSLKNVNPIAVNCMTNGEKVICFVTGVPGAGKTLVGLNVATRHQREEGQPTHATFLSGKGRFEEA